MTGNLVFAGNGYVIDKTNTDPYKGIDVKGKIIVVAGVPPEVAAAQAAGRGGRGRGEQAQPPRPLERAGQRPLRPRQPTRSARLAKPIGLPSSTPPRTERWRW